MGSAWLRGVRDNAETPSGGGISSARAYSFSRIFFPGTFPEQVSVVAMTAAGMAMLLYSVPLLYAKPSLRPASSSSTSAAHIAPGLLMSSRNVGVSGAKMSARATLPPVPTFAEQSPDDQIFPLVTPPVTSGESGLPVAAVDAPRRVLETRKDSQAPYRSVCMRACIHGCGA